MYKVEIRNLAIRAAIDIENISLSRNNMVDAVRNLEPLKRWFCDVSCIFITITKDNNLQLLWGETYIVSRALGCDLHHPIRGDEASDLFSRLNCRLAENLRTLQAICHDPATKFEDNDVRALLLVCVELSKSAMAESW